MSGVRCNLLLMIRRIFFSLHQCDYIYTCIYFFNKYLKKKSPNFSKTLYIDHTYRKEIHILYVVIIIILKKIIYLFSSYYESTIIGIFERIEKSNF